MVVVSLITLRALFRAPATTKTMPHACGAVSDVISSSGITESSTDPPAVPPANLVGDASVSDGRWVGVVEGALL